jgi:hypothetical protein
MSLNIKDSGSWRDATEVHIKHSGSWRHCKEVYIKKDGTWQPVLYGTSTSTITATGVGTMDVPKGAFRAVITINGGAGGTGGGDGNHPSSPGGNGASISATINVDPFTTLSYNIASVGSNGQGHASSASGGTGGFGYASGGTGGNAGSAGSSGGGGAGGGASSLLLPNGTVVLVAGGGSGGGGSGNQAQLSASQVAGKDSNKIVTDIYASSDGGHGSNCGTADGGAGGGGGGGVSGEQNVDVNYQLNSWGYGYSESSTGFASISDMHVVHRNSRSACTEGSSFGWSGGTAWVNNGCRALFNITGTSESGAGGAYMGSYDSDGYPGEAGVSYYNPDLVNVSPSMNVNSGNGSIVFTWLSE